ncbi:hypothetical protein FHX57_002014 [Paraburkholderia tropica]|uniref:hypothetical protein n=1 Tax=Paraburkholderia tropica TaxID=92647 RepID=UPI00162183C6|nr:hypothetical protein [Paraburkholderia tropica]MBB2999683.1 hypothetical protein [Paraburkholderia tropica]
MVETNRRERRSAIVDYLANMDRPIATDAIAKALSINPVLACTRVRQLESKGRIRRVGTATRMRDVRWVPADPTVGARPPEQISFRAAENIEAMRTAAASRLARGLPADWTEEPDEVTP